MISKRAIVLAVTCGLASATAVAVVVGYKRIDAEFQITGANTTDLAPNQRMDRVALFLSGDGARSIYDALAVPEENGEACEDGMQLKRAGGLVCSKNGSDSYSCSVGIILTSGETRPVGSC